MTHNPSHPAPSRPASTLGLTVGSIGVVYGDIGTSPLYAFRESLAHAAAGSAPSPDMVLGVLSLILWALLIIVTLKYVVLILRADNQGEGGILSLMALAQQKTGPTPWIVMLGITGCALFFGDAMITPAISVLSAVEGLSLVEPAAIPYIIPLVLAIMVALFTAQRRGTKSIARFFGPVMATWFLVMAAGGLRHIAQQPQVWLALNPLYAVDFLATYRFAGFIALGAVFLAVTGAEALYADLGHFGKKPIRKAWLCCALPSLMLNYFGQAALVLSQPEAAADSFFLLYPGWALLPMVAFASVATIIASQAVITGAFSMAHQAIQLGLLPRLHVQYTSQEQAGQIYMPQVNWFLLCGVVLLIEIFRSSSNLASAYGIAVTGTMVITAVLAFIVARRCWGWSLLNALLAIAPLLLIDLTFLAANLLKFFEGGFFPVLISLVMMLMMRTWVRGSLSVREQSYHADTSMAGLVKRLEKSSLQRVAGTAFYLTSSVDYAPSALQQNLTHNKVLHERNILLTLRFENRPYVPDAEKLEQQTLNGDFIRLFVNFGYMESPNVLRALELWRARGNVYEQDSSSFFISRRNIVPSASFGMPVWRDHLYIAMANNASDAADYFCLPLSRVVELGVQMTV